MSVLESVRDEAAKSVKLTSTSDQLALDHPLYTPVSFVGEPLGYQLTNGEI